MFGSAFGLPRFYESPGYYDYPGAGGYGGFNGYGRRTQDYPRSYGYNMPYAELSPNMQHMYGIPVEIPVIHEGHGNAAAKRSTGKGLNSFVPEQRTLNRDIQDRQPSPKCPQDEHNQRTYPVRQISMNEMDVSDDDDDGESYPFYRGMPLNDFGGGFPFSQRNFRSRPPTFELPRSRAPPQMNRAKPQSKSSNAPAEKASSLQHTTEPCKSPTVKPPQNYKSRTVPIVMEHAKEQHTKHIPNPLEQLESIKAEMNDIATRVDNFSGVKSDKEYIYLDEMITSLLLKLDMIESNGVDEIRNKRRQLVRHAQDCIEKLEQRVGILPTKEETKSAGDTEIIESMEDEVSELEATVDLNMVPLDIPDGEISGVAPVGCQDEAEHPVGSSLTEAAITSPAQIEIEQTVVAKDDVATPETVSENNCSNTSAEAIELSNITKGTSVSQEEMVADNPKDMIRSSTEQPDIVTS